MASLAQTRVLVIGGSSGIGEAVARGEYRLPFRRQTHARGPDGHANDPHA